MTTKLVLVATPDQSVCVSRRVTVWPAMGPVPSAGVPTGVGAPGTPDTAGMLVLVSVTAAAVTVMVLRFGFAGEAVASGAVTKTVSVEVG